MMSRVVAARLLQSHACRRFTSTTSAVANSNHRHRPPAPTARLLITQPPRCLASAVRWLSTTGGDDGGKSSDTDEKKPKEDPSKDMEDDIFGVNFEDGDDRMGEAPPLYKRDETTGRWSEEKEQEISDTDKSVLELSSAEQDSLVQDRVQEHWDEQGDDWASRMGQSVRQAEAGMTVLGRSTEAQGTKEPLLDSNAARTGPGQFSQRLTRKEFESFQTYMRKQHKQTISEEDFPVMEKSEVWKKTAKSTDDSKQSTMYMTSLAQRQMDNTKSDDPFDDLLPSDLNVHRLVNRKNAKPIPQELLHHNNVALLRSYMSPTGQINHRLHTKLGAKDQRKIKKLIKRARMLGLLPYQGQFSVESHGWIHAPDIDEKRGWEEELERRGLVVKDKEPEKRLEDHFPDVPEAMDLGFAKK